MKETFPFPFPLSPLCTLCPLWLKIQHWGIFNAKDANVTRKGREKMQGARKILGYFVFFSRSFSRNFRVFRV
jgi:hypothetical protein